MKLILSIAAGGAFGAVGRYYIMSLVGHFFGHGYPYGTLVVNLLGGFLLGALIETSALVGSMGEDMRAFLVIGLLGSLTTFSTFSLDVYTLFVRGNIVGAGVYILVSVVVSVLALIAGMYVFRLMLT